MAGRKAAPGLLPGLLPTDSLGRRLWLYKQKNDIHTKGKLGAILFAARLARQSGLPFDIKAGIVTDSKGQIKGLGKAAVQKVLADYGITRVLAEEAGRTTRSSLGSVENFLLFLNELHFKGRADLEAIEAWWVEQAKAFFNAKPFALRFEPGKSLRSVIRDLISQAKKRQDESGGTMFVGAMLQHLVGAKLELALATEVITHHGFSVADAPGGRSGDFEIGNASLHVTTMPGEAVIRKCAANLHAGRHPIVITMRDMLPAADVFAEAQGIADKLDILDAEQFIVANLHELGGFKSALRRVTIEALVEKYNVIVDRNETDPSLRISTE